VAKQTFANFIAPETLVDIVRNTAPFLFDRDVLEITPTYSATRLRFTLDTTPYWRIVRNSGDIKSTPKPSEQEWVRYFELCVAAHVSTVATFVPSDVDTKIRNHLWFDRKLSRDALTAMKDIALATERWDVRAVTQAWVPDKHGASLSGHDGEKLSILTAGMQALLLNGDTQGADELEACALRQTEREAEAFLTLVDTKGRERDMLMLAAIITHNAGDIDQGFSTGHPHPARAKIGRLAHERPERYHGAYAIAAKLYRELLAAEGHRNYPLRAMRELRVDPDLMKPPSPFLDPWGERLAGRQQWSTRDKALVLQGLMDACARVRGQVAYYRAIAGMNAAVPVEHLAKELSVNARKTLREPRFQRPLQTTREQFEADMARRARASLPSRKGV
jgi:hypothetical protein